MSKNIIEITDYPKPLKVIKVEEIFPKSGFSYNPKNKSKNLFSKLELIYFLNILKSNKKIVLLLLLISIIDIIFKIILSKRIHF